MDGYEATRRIRAAASVEETTGIRGRRKEGARGCYDSESQTSLNVTSPVIFAVTANAYEGEREMVLTAGCDDFIRKPFKSALLFEKIAAHLGVRYAI